jgi:hypothetical protein
MVATETGNWHHGIYVGYQAYEGQKVPMVVDVWGLNKEQATISLRPYSLFVHGASGFAKAKYPEADAVNLDVSLALAMFSVKWAEKNKFVYNLKDNNCEHWATMCRCLRWVHVIHDALQAQLESVPDIPRQPPHKRGFKGI